MAETLGPECCAIMFTLERIRDGWSRLDLGVAFAFGWLLFALIASVWWGPQLGFRGLVWLGMHHVLCAVGCTHELRRGWRRHRVRRGKVSSD
jgi:hypothetical protein